DSYENSKGTMQWVVLLSGDGHAATGVHTWVEGFLSPVYRSILQRLQQRGYQITSIRKEKDGLLKFLTSVANGQTAALTGRPALADFQDPFAGTTTPGAG